MSMVLSTVSAIQLCAGCALEFETRVTLGARDDPAGPGFFAEVLDAGDQGYLVSSEILGGVVLVYDSEGRYQRELTREGEGPGELIAPPRFAIGTGGILMFEPGNNRLHLFARDLEFIRTFQVPGALRVGPIQPDPATGGWLVGYLGEDSFGILLLDQEGNVARSMQPGAGAANLRGWQAAIRATDGMIWTASLFGLVELYDEDLAPLGSIQLELPGMEGWEAPRDGPVGWPAQVNDIRLAPDGSGLWIFAVAPEERLAELSVDELRDEFMANAGPMEQVVDAYIYWVRLDPGGLTVVGMDNFDTLVRPLGDEDLAFDLFETPDGNRRARVGRLRLTRTAPDTPDS
ncbi:MAG: hypothetical protein F4087_10100 [Gemmatimonadetes bacterium]|nr:hypothetical protein [Gemmatimonadota bacterium]MYA11677.1 hypothetical protein [Gemmatimonadota bacterium]MYE69551.1 hypothetical protein [Gemmatimonadota bacterium]MYJ68843.1 hypothetical protein [Gemmatimonadota bacterium]